MADILTVKLTYFLNHSSQMSEASVLNFSWPVLSKISTHLCQWSGKSLDCVDDDFPMWLLVAPNRDNVPSDLLLTNTEDVAANTSRDINKGCCLTCLLWRKVENISTWARSLNLIKTVFKLFNQLLGDPWGSCQQRGWEEIIDFKSKCFWNSGTRYPHCAERLGILTKVSTGWERNFSMNLMQQSRHIHPWRQTVGCSVGDCPA